MAHNEKVWHINFKNYMDFIVNHPNYSGLPITRNNNGDWAWVKTAESDIGRGRILWCKKKAVELGLIKTIEEPYAGMYADVMLAIHPTGYKACQICGREMSLRYHYPNANFLKSINNTFNSNFTECDHISDIWDVLLSSGYSSSKIASFLIKKGALTNVNISSPKESIIDALELACRKGGKKCLGPGAMSNFPDRYDGFHTYNRCCRKREDTGRHDDNMKSYTKDRRAYEYWSDGNIHAANQFMGSAFFKDISADHIGPISLGFVHDPRYLQPMTTNDNSSKRDRLQYDDVVKIIEIETQTRVKPISWYSERIWDYIKNNFKANPNKVSEEYRDLLKQSMSNYMYILNQILESGNKGKDFLIEVLLTPKYECFKYTYTFNSNGTIKSQEPRNFTGRSDEEFDRYVRIALESVSDYNNKDNRHVNPYLTKDEEACLFIICSNIQHDLWHDAAQNLTNLVVNIQNRLINSLH